jgi:hypothetical protein
VFRAVFATSLVCRLTRGAVVSDEFRDWYEIELDEDEQFSVARVVRLLAEEGPALPYPQSTAIANSRMHHMRELRIQHQGRPYRVLYAFDPTRAGYLMLGGEKTGDDRWYQQMIPKAEAIYRQHLREIEEKERSERKH